MTAPLKVGDKGSGLTCDEHDANIDRFLDRSNHTGTQDCSTITGLDACVSTLPTVTNLQALIDALELQVQNIESQLAVDGQVDDRIQALRDDLIQEINTVNSNLTALQSIVTDNTTNITANTAQITALNNLATSIQSAYQAADAALDTRVSLLETTVSNHTTLINTNTAGLAQELLDRAAQDNTLQNNINAEQSARIAADNTLQQNIDAEASARATAILSEQGDRQNADQALQNAIDTEETNRTNADGGLQTSIDNLQTQIDTINTQISGVASQPVGSILVSIQGITQPLINPGYLLCNGAAVDRVTYAALFAVIGTKFGIGDGASTFNLPNLQDRFLFGTTLAGETGELGGETQKALAAANIPTHSHPVIDPGHLHYVAHPAHGHGVIDVGHAHTIPDSSHSHAITNNNLMEEGGPSQTKLLVADGGDDRFEFYDTGTANVNLGGTGGSTSGIGIQTNATFGDSNPAFTGITTGDSGLGTPFTFTPSYMKCNFFIKT